MVVNLENGSKLTVSEAGLLSDEALVTEALDALIAKGLGDLKLEAVSKAARLGGVGEDAFEEALKAAIKSEKVEDLKDCLSGLRTEALNVLKEKDFITNMLAKFGGLSVEDLKTKFGAKVLGAEITDESAKDILDASKRLVGGFTSEILTKEELESEVSKIKELIEERKAERIVAVADETKSAEEKDEVIAEKNNEITKLTKTLSQIEGMLSIEASDDLLPSTSSRLSGAFSSVKGAFVAGLNVIASTLSSPLTFLYQLALRGINYFTGGENQGFWFWIWS